MTIVLTKASSRSANIAKWTVVDRLVRRVIVKVTNVAAVSGERLSSGWTFLVDTLIPGRLEGTTPHA
jgi:hypothetical protein